MITSNLINFMFFFFGVQQTPLLSIYLLVIQRDETKLQDSGKNLSLLWRIYSRPFLRLRLRKQRRVGQSKQWPPAFLSLPLWQTAADPIWENVSQRMRHEDGRREKGNQNLPSTHISQTFPPSLWLFLSFSVSHTYTYTVCIQKKLFYSGYRSSRHTHTHTAKCHCMNSCLLGGRRGRSEEY